ncbi:MAG TPA: hypothetical protein VHI52_17660 [Verrucomicrobiae bacterium]|nr:hypothetical protein [Verrucomicrobiae bacterium]
MSKIGKLLASVGLGVLICAFFSVGSADAATQSQGPVLHREAGSVQFDYGNGKVTGWVSHKYLDAHQGKISNSDVQPLSATNCSVNVCAVVEGDSVYVSNWGTQAYGNVGCTEAFYDYAPPGGAHGYPSGPTICPDSPDWGVYYDYTGPVGYFPNQSALCNTWNYVSGRPCVIIVQ